MPSTFSRRLRPSFPSLPKPPSIVVVLALVAVTARGGETTPELPGPSSRPTYTLSDCVTLAIRQNPDVLIAAKRVEGARAAVTQAKAGIFPTVQSSGYYQRREQGLASEGNVDVNRRTDDYNVDVRASQNLYSSGAVRARIAVAKLGERAAALDYQAQLETTILAVRVAFYQTLYAEGTIGVRQQALDLLGAQLKDQRDRLSAGSVSQINVNRAQVALANEEPALNEARYNLHAAYVTLAQALAIQYAGGAGDAPFRVRGELAYRPGKYSLDDCLRRAENQRPEIASRQLEIESLNHQIIADKSTTRPRLDAFAAYDIYSETTTLAKDDSFNGYTIGFNASWQIFDGFATLGRVRATRARIGGAAASLTATRQQVQSDVRTAYYQLQEAEATLRPQADNIRLANETLQVTQNNFAAGLAAQLDVLSSRVDLTRAQSTELSGRLAYNQAVARLERAMGEGRPANIPPPVPSGKAVPVRAGGPVK